MKGFLDLQQSVYDEFIKSLKRNNQEKIRWSYLKLPNNRQNDVIREKNTFENFFSPSIKVLQDQKIDFMIVGGAVLPYYSNFRTTQDIDIMILSDNINDERFIVTYGFQV